MAEIEKEFSKEAVEILKKELSNAKDKDFAKPIIEYLIKRCEEDSGMALDVCQPHKTWQKCFAYIYEQAKKSAKGSRQCAVRDDVVFEWAEDYYHMDDKAEEEKKTREKAEADKKAKKKKTVSEKTVEERNETVETSDKKQVIKTGDKKQAIKKGDKKPASKISKKTKKEDDGQMDIFSFLGE